MNFIAICNALGIMGLVGRRVTDYVRIRHQSLPLPVNLLTAVANAFAAGYGQIHRLPILPLNTILSFELNKIGPLASIQQRILQQSKIGPQKTAISEALL